MMQLRTKKERYAAFYDFLNLTLWSFCLDPVTDEPNLDELDMDLVLRYSSADFDVFRQLLAVLVSQVEQLTQRKANPDVLGTFYAKQLAIGRLKPAFAGRKWSPSQVLQLETSQKTKQCFVDEDCGSGQRLLAARSLFGAEHYYLGIDTDPVCAMMATFNLLISSSRGEVICGSPGDNGYFVFGYRFYRSPLRLQRLRSIEESMLWKTYQTHILK